MRAKMFSDRVLAEFDGATRCKRSAEASDSSKACSTVGESKPSISRMRPENMFLPFSQQSGLADV